MRCSCSDAGKPFASPDVLSGGHYFQMVRVDACSVSAKVVDHQARRDRTEALFIDEAMSHLVPSAPSNPVAIRLDLAPPLNAEISLHRGRPAGRPAAAPPRPRSPGGAAA